MELLSHQNQLYIVTISVLRAYPHSQRQLDVPSGYTAQACDQIIIIIIIFTMVQLHCLPDGSCPYQWSCDSHRQCLHDPVFPATLYPILIYCLFPIASAICNTSGNSFGQFKVILLMDLLDYTESQATVLTYPLNIGTSLFNYITLIFRRHPRKDTTLVDYNIVTIIIPSVLYGSTIGALVNKFIPPIAADVIIMIILGAFSVKFFNRFYNFRKEAKLEELKQKIVELDDLSSYGKKSQTRKSIHINAEEQTPKSLDIKAKDEQISEGKEQGKQEGLPEGSQVNQFRKQLESQLKYESGYHIPDIFLTYLVFLFFETLSFLAQGKIIPFTICSDSYKIGVSALTLVFVGMQTIVYLFTKKKMLYYRKIQYPYTHKLESPKLFISIVVASFLGGFNGGAFGLGSSTTMIFTLLFLGIEPIVVSATVGYQIIFSNLASLAQAFIRGDITYAVAGLFIGITFIGGGILSFITMTVIKRFSQNKTNQILMLIVGCLTGSSVIALIVNIVLGYKNFGTTFMNSSAFSC